MRQRLLSFARLVGHSQIDVPFVLCVGLVTDVEECWPLVKSSNDSKLTRLSQRSEVWNADQVARANTRSKVSKT